jgi:uncharacterized heparinase superfamily protein
MHFWLLALCHPDGEIGFFNDAAFDVAPSVVELDAYARRILQDLPPLKSSSVIVLQDTGYIRVADGPAVALLDVAPVGPDYLPGHAHADTLTFELSIGAQRVLVNSGTSCYGRSAERLRQRGTAAHNTLLLDGEDSSEVWDGFRVARRAYPVGLRIERGTGGNPTMVTCAHDGYTRLRGKPVHHRTWSVNHSGMTVADRIDGAFRAAEARFHFHPSVQVQMGPQQDRGVIILPDGSEIAWRLDAGHARLDASTWHPRFGASQPNVCLAVKVVDGASIVHFHWN